MSNRILEQKADGEKLYNFLSSSDVQSRSVKSCMKELGVSTPQELVGAIAYIAMALDAKLVIHKYNDEAWIALEEWEDV